AMEAPGSGSGAAEAVEDDRIQETAHGGSNSNASSNGGGAPSAAAPPPPRATPFHLEQAGSGADGSSPATAVDPRKGKDPLLPRDIPPPPSPAGSSSSTRSRDYAAAFRDGVGESSKAGARRARVRWSHPVVAETREVPNAAAHPLDPNTVFEQMAIQQAADEEANRRREHQARASATCSCCFLDFLESLSLQVWSAFLSISWFPAEQYNSEEAMYRKEQEKLSQVQVGVKVRPKQDKLPHVQGKSFWSRFKNKEKLRQVKVRPRSEKGKSPWSWLKNKIFCREGRQICPEHVQHQTQPITEVMNRYTVCSNGMNSLNAYSEFRPVIGDGECFYRSFIFSYLEQVLDRPDTDEERRLLDVVEKASARHADLGWNSKFSRSSREMHNCLTVVACRHSFTQCWHKLKFEAYCEVNNPIVTTTLREIYLQCNNGNITGK
uniref:Uncharacterized protein n=4 Tax=Aegilops tauschii subsp. strangulata TaxID=200361 RepID=A0A453AMA8_AEGTS